MRILLHAEQLSERGTTTAILEYSKYLRSNGFSCSIAFLKGHPMNDARMIKEIHKEFELIPYRYFWNLRRMEKRFDVGYFIKSGSNNGQVFDKTPSIVHAVFQDYDPHGDLYLYVSKWLAEKMKTENLKSRHSKDHYCRTRNCSEFEYLDHMVSLPNPDSSLRSSLGISKDAVVGVRYGGYETFDIDWVKDAVIKMLDIDVNLHFVFANTRMFIEHSRVHFLDTRIDQFSKAQFLATGDFFLHGRQQGESFGLAILEAVTMGLPVLTYSGGLDLNHLNLVPSQLTYSDDNSLMAIVAGREYKKHNEFFREIKEEYSTNQVGSKLIQYIQRLV